MVVVWWCGGVVVWWCGGVVDLWSHFFCSVRSVPFHSFFVSVGRSPTFVRNAHGLPVHDFLFASRHEYEDKKKLLLADDRRKRNMNFNKSHVTELSSKLINHARRRKR